MKQWYALYVSLYSYYCIFMDVTNDTRVHESRMMVNHINMASLHQIISIAQILVSNDN